MSKLQFRHFAGDAHYKNMNVAVYGDKNDNRILIAENQGDEICRKTVSADEYADLREEWTNGGRISDGDVNVTIAALDYVGAFSGKRGAKHGNTNAVKKDADKSTANFIGRCRESDKAAWERTADAEGLTTTAWIIKTLNANVVK